MKIVQRISEELQKRDFVVRCSYGARLKDMCLYFRVFYQAHRFDMDKLCSGCSSKDSHGDESEGESSRETTSCFQAQKVTTDYSFNVAHESISPLQRKSTRACPQCSSSRPGRQGYNRLSVLRRPSKGKKERPNVRTYRSGRRWVPSVVPA